MDKLYRYFAPVNLPHAVEHESECATYPCVTLRQVDKVYGIEGVGKSIVRTLITGVYSMSTTREQMPKEAADNAAGLFVAKYGNECTLYALMVYFGNYLTEYKSTYAQFDVQDILQQYHKKFLPRWRMKLGEENQQIQTNRKDEINGLEALKLYIRNNIMNGDDLRTGYLYKNGTITDSMIEEEQMAIKAGVF